MTSSPPRQRSPLWVVIGWSLFVIVSSAAAAICLLRLGINMRFYLLFLGAVAGPLVGLGYMRLTFTARLRRQPAIETTRFAEAALFLDMLVWPMALSMMGMLALLIVASNLLLPRIGP